MAHKVHPKAFRIKEISDWYSRGFYEKDFPRILEEDFRIREFLHKKLTKIGISEIEIDRYPGKTNITISCVRPGLIIGRQGQGIEELKKRLEKEVFRKRKWRKEAFQEIRVEIKEISSPWASADYMAQWVAGQLERRMPYLRVLKQGLDKAMMSKDVQGVRIQVSGRLNGVEIARTAWLSKGRLPRQTLRADIDYALAQAYCTYGVIGVKVWIYKGEKI